MSNILIVESKNDKIFLEALIKYLNYDIEIEPPIYVNDYEELNGLDDRKLIRALKDLKADIQKRDINKIGIVIDLDKFTLPARLQWVNDCLESVFNQNNMLSGVCQLNQITTEDDKNIQLACYFTNVEGKGELETVLKRIKSKDSKYADCLNQWKTCIKNQGYTISDKEFDKFWISIYLRYDTCSKEDKKQAQRKCTMSNFNYIMENKREIWNFEDPVLDDLKTFLGLFSHP